MRPHAQREDGRRMDIMPAAPLYCAPAALYTKGILPLSLLEVGWVSLLCRDQSMDNHWMDMTCERWSRPPSIPGLRYTTGKRER